MLWPYVGHPGRGYASRVVQGRGAEAPRLLCLQCQGWPAGKGALALDLAVVFGIVLAAASLVVAHMLGGGTIAGLVSPVGLIVIVGGTLGATTTAVGLDRIKEIPGNVLLAMRRESANQYTFIEDAARWFTILRKDGRLELEKEARRQGDNLLRYALQAVADGRPEDEVVPTMLNMIRQEQFAAGIAAAVFEKAGGFAPTFGIMATVLGLIEVLGALANPSKLGPSIATAFLGTFYGIGSANVFWLPISARLSMKSQERAKQQLLYTEAIRLLWTATGPGEVRERLWRIADPNRDPEEASQPMARMAAGEQAT